MTREEAIYRLKNMAWLYGSAEREQNIEAINMAIEALHREEAEEKGYCHRIRPSNVEVVVRCKDCRHQRFYINDKESFHCDKAHIANMHMDDGDGDFFCKYGERREL